MRTASRRARSASAPPAAGTNGSRRAFNVDHLTQPEVDRRVRRLPYLLRRSIGIVWSAAPRLLVGAAVLQVVSAVGLAVQLLLARSVLESLLELASVDAYGPLWEDLAVLTAVSLVVAGAGVVRAEQQRVMGELVSQHTMGQVVRVGSSVPAISYERSEFADRLQRAAVNASSRPLQMTNGVLGLVGGVTSIAAIASAVFVLEPLLLAGIAVAYVPATLASRRGALLLHQFAVRNTENDRRRRYLYTLLVRREEAAEVRRYNLGPFIHGWYDHLCGERLEDLKGVVRRRLRLSLTTSLLTAAVVPATLGSWLGASTRAKRASPPR